MTNSRTAAGATNTPPLMMPVGTKDNVTTGT